MSNIDLQPDKLTDESNFTVKEAKGVDMTFGFLFLGLTLFIFYHIVADYHYDQLRVYYKLMILSFVPSLVFFRNYFNKTIAITINREGIYRKNKLVTNWNNFIRAYISQDQITGSITDNFVLFIEYYKTNESGYFVRKVNISDTWDKSEEQMIDAIRYFSKFSVINNN